MSISVLCRSDTVFSKINSGHRKNLTPEKPRISGQQKTSKNFSLEVFSSTSAVFSKQKTRKHKLTSFLVSDDEQRYKDSNLEMTESESVALPFGDSALS